jgi:hypothetical protein
MLKHMSHVDGSCYKQETVSDDTDDKHSGDRSARKVGGTVTGRQLTMTILYHFTIGMASKVCPCRLEVCVGRQASQRCHAWTAARCLCAQIAEEIERVASLDTTTLQSAEFAATLDGLDPLAPLRDQFLIPPTADTASLRAAGSQALYFCGNSLGLQPKGTRAVIEEELEKWALVGVEVRPAHVPHGLSCGRRCGVGAAVAAVLAPYIGALPD